MYFNNTSDEKAGMTQKGPVREADVSLRSCEVS